MPASLSRVALVTGSGKKRVGWYVADALAGPTGCGDGLFVDPCCRRAVGARQHGNGAVAPAKAGWRWLVGGSVGRLACRGGGRRLG
jgi:hypothetical protein